MASCLSPRFIFGVQGSRSNAIGFSDQATLVYLAGHNVVIYNILDGKQRFIHGSELSESITAMALCPSSRFIAIAEDSDKPFVSLYDLRTLRLRKTLQIEENGAQYVSVAFSHDSNLLLTQGGGPDWNLVLWSWAKARQLARIHTSNNLPIYQVSFSPMDTSLACVSGNSICQFYRMTEGDLRPMTVPQVKDHNFLSHAWLKQPEDHLVLGTETGQLLLFRSGDFLCYLVGAPGGSTKITVIISYSQGFIIGCSEGGIHLYTMDHADSPVPAKMFNCRYSWRVDTTADVVGLALCPSEDRLCAVTSDNQLFEVKIISQHIKDSNMKPLISLFHRPGRNSGGITGMDTCVRKPLVVTCGMDHTIRLWNIMEQRLDVWKIFREEPFSVAMHPSGLLLAVGFADKLRLMNLLLDDIRTCHEFPIKQCREVKFSNGGSMFAAVNGNIIAVFDLNTRDKLAELRGHNSKVRHLSWGGQDLTLVSCGQDGAVYQWDIDEAKRVGEFVQKGTAYSCARSTKNSTKESIFAVGNDRALKELEVPDLQVAKELNAGVTLGQIVLSNSEHMMFAGTSEGGKPGCVRAYNLPLTGDYLEYVCVGTPVTRLCITHDDQFLLVADEASCLFVFDVRDRQGRGQAASNLGSDELESLAASEEVLVTRSNFEDKNTLMVELKTKADGLALHNEYQLRLKDMNYSEKIKEITENFARDLEQSKNKFELLREEKSHGEMESEALLLEMDENHQHKLQELENTYQLKIMGEVERYQTLLHERNMQQDRWEEQQQLLVTTHERYVAELTEEFEQKLGENRQLRLQLHDEKTELGREYSETVQQLEDDIDMEIDNLRNRFESQLAVEREAILRYKGENGIMKKKFTVLTNDIEDQKEEIRALHEKEKDLKQKIKGLEREIAAHKKDIKYRDDTIGEKEKMIYGLKKKNQELEKFKFVLDFKIKELKRQIDPRETEIDNMKEQIKEMDSELEQFHNSNAQLDLLIGDLRERLDEMQAQYMDHRKRIAYQEASRGHLQRELHECVQHIQEPETLRQHVATMYRSNVGVDLPRTKMDPNVIHEYQRHRGYLEFSLRFLHNKFTSDVPGHRAENTKIMQNNMLLIKEINMQRGHNKAQKPILERQVNMLKRIGTSSKHLHPAEVKRTPTPATTTIPSIPSGERPETRQEEPTSVIENNKAKIAELRALVADLEGRVVSNLPCSQEVLPPMDGRIPSSS